MVTKGLAKFDSDMAEPSESNHSELFRRGVKLKHVVVLQWAEHSYTSTQQWCCCIHWLVGTDHCAFNSTHKAFGIDNFRKIPYGVNDNYELFWFLVSAKHRREDASSSGYDGGQISITDYVRITSTEWIFNIYPRKGAILVGSDADIIIFNPNSSFEISATSHHSRLDTNVFEGRRGKGKVEVKIAGGRIVWENGQLKVALGDGKYVEMQPFSYLFGGIDKADA
ncbi:unnamed protein product [Camellia sinensis]